jgi:hypothetical protein
LAVFELTDKVAQRRLVRTGGPGKVKGEICFRASRASGKTRIAKVTGTFRAKRRDIMDNRIMALRTQYFRRGMDVVEIFFTNKTVRGINQIVQTG